jgi:hypothetical protein
MSQTSSNPAEGDVFLRAIKFHSTTFFGGEVKLWVLCCKIWWYADKSYRHENRYFVGKIHGHFLPSFSCFDTRCLLGTARELW